jgi:hypothetical protein
VHGVREATQTLNRWGYTLGWQGVAGKNVGYVPPIVPLDTPNTEGKRTRTVGVVVHATRGKGRDQQKEYEGALATFRDSGSKVSAHAVIGPDGTIAFLRDQDAVTWHAEEHNAEMLGVELAQSEREEPFTEEQYQTLGWYLRRMSERYGFKLDRTAIVGHQETTQGQRRGKSDPGKQFDWDKALKYAKHPSLAPPPKHVGGPAPGASGAVVAAEPDQTLGRTGAPRW